jgi:hypothetical protein
MSGLCYTQSAKTRTKTNSCFDRRNTLSRCKFFTDQIYKVILQTCVCVCANCIYIASQNITYNTIDITLAAAPTYELKYGSSVVSQHRLTDLLFDS